MLERVAGLRQVLKQVVAGLKVKAITTISRLLAFFGVFCLLASVVIVRSSADTYTLTTGIQGNNQAAYDLVSTFRNSDYWNPFADYIIFQIPVTSGSGISTHYIGAFGDLSNPYVWEMKYLTVNRDSVRQINFLGQDNNFRISNPNNQSVVGSGPDQIHSELMETYKYQFVLLVFAFVFIIVFLFKSFRFNHSPYRG